MADPKEAVKFPRSNYHPMSVYPTCLPPLDNGSAGGTRPSKPARSLVLSQSVLRQSQVSVRQNFNRQLTNPKVRAYIISSLAQLSSASKFDRRDRHLLRNAARRTVALARATRAALKAKERRYSTRIQEIEQYLGLLRNKRAIVQNRSADADEQMGYAMDILHQNHIPEESLSDYEDDADGSSTYHCLPPSSDIRISDAGSSNSSCSDSESDDYPLTASGPSPCGDISVVEGFRQNEWERTGAEGSLYSLPQEKQAHA